MEKRELYLCNTVYQVLVALWIKYHYERETEADVIISNHMNGGAKIAERIRACGQFDRVYFAETLDIARYRVHRSKGERIIGDLFPVRQLKKTVSVDGKYTDLYVANFDGFTQMLFNALSRKNKSLKLHVFEDGLSTYCSFEAYYQSMEHYYYDISQSPQHPIKRFIREKVYRKRSTFGNISQILVFNPDVMQWNPDCEIFGMDKIDRSDSYFRSMVNRIFGYETSTDRYDKKYLFFEESFYADGYAINDVELVEKLAAHVGKENIMIKIHPRNPENRFAALGYKTNRDTSIPWEVIMMNMDNVSDTVFVTIASSAILNPIMIFGLKIRAYSLYPCLNTIPPTLQGPSWTFLKACSINMQI